MLPCLSIAREQTVHKLLARLAIQSCNCYQRDPGTPVRDSWANSADKAENSQRRGLFLAK